jgi:hypothetical protein
MSDTWIWRRWFAWWPVTVDAYQVSEIRDQKFSYRVWLRTVEWCFADRVLDDEDPSHTTRVTLYRLPQG